MDFTGMIAKINLFSLFLQKFLCTLKLHEKVPLFHKNLIRACGPGHLRGAGGLYHSTSCKPTQDKKYAREAVGVCLGLLWWQICSTKDYVQLKEP
jgi:hypothetical protein